MNHQDWEPVVIGMKKKNKAPAGAAPSAAGTATTVSNKPAWKIEQQVDADHGKPLKYVSRDDAKAIIKARIAMKLSQKEVAMRLNLQVKDVNDIESGKAVENRLILSKIRRVLQI